MNGVADSAPYVAAAASVERMRNASRVDALNLDGGQLGSHQMR